MLLANPRSLVINAGINSSYNANDNWPRMLVPFATTMSIYAAVEIGFYIYYYSYLYPKGNELTTPCPYPGIYSKNRVALLQRILDRAERTCRLSNRCAVEYMTEYFGLMVSCDDDNKDVLEEDKDDFYLSLSHLSTISDEATATCESSDSSTTSSCSKDSDENNEKLMDASLATTDTSTVTSTASGRWVHPLLHKGDCNHALAFGFFAKDYNDLEEWELHQVEEMLNIYESRFGITFREGFKKGYYVRRISLDDVDALHRPLSYYALVRLAKTCCDHVLKFFGFCKFKSKTTSLVCWHRPLSSKSSFDTETNTTKFLPTLFFHGIFPSGLSLYIPMLLYGLLHEYDRPIFLFELPYIASAFGFDNFITKEDTMIGVKEILDQFPYTKNASQPLSVIGHSFGTFVATWCVYEKALRQRIKSLILLDPVSILLSEPDVMNSFDKPGFLFWLFATSELHVNHYVRRQFHWYTSELWLDDIPEDTYTLIGLAHEDTIVNSPKVKREILTFTEHKMIRNINNKKNTNNKFLDQTKILYWHNARHGHCCLTPKVWKQMKNVFMQQESLILKQKK